MREVQGLDGIIWSRVEWRERKEGSHRERRVNQEKRESRKREKHREKGRIDKDRESNRENERNENR